MAVKHVICPACGRYCKQVSGGMYCRRYECPECGCKVELTGGAVNERHARCWADCGQD